MLQRLLRYNIRNFRSFSRVRETNASKAQTNMKQQQKQQYLVMPTKMPIFPYTTYFVKIRKELYNYIKKSNIEYIAACVLQSGVTRKKFIPTSQSQLIQELNLKPVKSTGKQDTNMTLNDLNFGMEFTKVIFDQNILKKNQEPPVYYFDHPSQIYPMASLCKIFASVYENSYILKLRSQIRLNINMQQLQKDSEKQTPIMYVSGQPASNQSTQNEISKSKQYLGLLQSYKKISNTINLNMAPQQETHLSPYRFIEVLSGYLSSTLYFNTVQLYHLFSLLNAFQRTKLLAEYFNQYANVLNFRYQHIDKKIEQKQKSNQKNIESQVYEHLQEMLGGKADLKYVKNVRAQLATGRFPQQIAEIIQSQLDNLQQIGEGNQENNRKKNFINLILAYPFGISAKQTFDIEKAKNILDEDHYGMKKVKQRILQFIAVSALKGSFKSKVLLLHGPPGVGKTSIVQSIAKSLNRPYGRISLGGEYDPSILKGHRKTYLGAYPGKIFDTISKAKVQNPVILLDQIDKIQGRVGGASLQDVVMSILDPIQNNKFKDQFMNIQIDLSKVLFICTANQLDTIFPPLLDRLQRIQVSGYTTGEKKQIFRKYVIRKSMQNAGIPDQLMQRMNFTDQALHSLIEGYCKQSGIRNLVRKTNSIFNKTALKYVKNEQFDTVITPKTLKQYLGLPKFKDSRLFQKIPPKGVIVGLAYNSYGGSIMYIEAAAAQIKEIKTQKQQEKGQARQMPKGSLIVTGNLHDVMKQSCQLAYTYAKYVTSTYFNNYFLETNDIHLNFPQIQIGKDGPSAGAAITCSLVSLALNKPSVRQIAMTGEITLSGRVTAIGGVKQKTMGAKRQGITHLIFPEENRKDIEQLQPQVRQGVTYYYVSHLYEVMEIVFGLKISEDAKSEMNNVAASTVASS